METSKTIEMLMGLTEQAQGLTVDEVKGMITNLDKEQLELVTKMYDTERKQIEKLLTFSPSAIKTALDKVGTILADAKKPTTVYVNGKYTKAELEAILATM